MKRHKHLFEQVCSFENLHAAAYAALRGKRGKKPAAAFFADLEEELVALHSELLSGTYQHGGYHYFQIHEPKERRVAAAPFRDRVAASPRKINGQNGNRNPALSAVPALDYLFVLRFCFAERQIRRHCLR